MGLGPKQMWSLQVVCGFELKVLGLGISVYRVSGLGFRV